MMLQLPIPEERRKGIRELEPNIILIYIPYGFPTEESNREHSKELRFSLTTA